MPRKTKLIFFIIAYLSFFGSAQVLHWNLAEKAVA
jgi:phosphatidylserine/phosphatidylglycerophosphate/cardiolipin synthase-like enzyme